MWPKLQNKSGVDLNKGFASLLTNHYGIDPVSRLPIDHKTNTKGANQYRNSQNVSDTSAKLANSKTLTEEAMATVSNPNSTKKSRKAAVQVVNKTVLPLIDIAVNRTCHAATHSSPIPSSKVAHKSADVQRRKEIEEEHPQAEPTAFMVEEYIQSNGSSTAFLEQ